MNVLIAPSILAADFASLGEAIGTVEAAGADWIHVDVMDGRFVPNITIGPVVVQSCRRATSLPLDVHLMIVEPDRYLEEFARAGADRITVHAEACTHLHRTIQAIHELGLPAGVAINPGTAPSVLSEVIGHVDLVLQMSVNPGFGGQSFIGGTEGRIRRIRAMLDEAGRQDAHIEVDGGIDVHTAPRVVEAGADVLVAGTSVFRHEDGPAAGVEALRGALLAADPARSG